MVDVSLAALLCLVDLVHLVHGITLVGMYRSSKTEATLKNIMLSDDFLHIYGAMLSYSVSLNKVKLLKKGEEYCDKLS